jgi:hypothetical protein
MFAHASLCTHNVRHQSEGNIHVSAQSCSKKNKCSFEATA